MKAGLSRLRSGRSSPATRIFLSAGARRESGSSIRARRARGTTPRASRRNSGSPPSRVVDALALMGDTIDKHQGRARHRRKGRTRMSDRPRTARSRNLLAHAAEVKKQTIPRRGCSPISTTGAARGRELARIRIERAGGLRTGGAAVPRRIARAELSDLQRTPGSGRWRRSTRRRPARSRRTTERSNTTEAVQQLAGSSPRRRPVRSAGSAGSARGAMRSAIVGLAFSIKPARWRLPWPIGHRSFGDAASLPLRNAALTALGPRPRRRDREERGARSESSTRIVLARHGITLRGARHVTRCWRATCSNATRSGHLIEDLALEHTSYKALTEEDVCGPRCEGPCSLAGRGPVEAALDYACERGGSRRADRAPRCAPPAREKNSSTSSTKGSSCRSFPCSWAIERGGHQGGWSRAGGRNR